MGEWVDISTEITSGDTLTSSAMQCFRDNIYGLCDQSCGAPVHTSLAFCLGSTKTANSYGYYSTSSEWETVCTAFVYIPYNADKITCGMSIWSDSGSPSRGRVRIGGETINYNTSELTNSVYEDQIDISSFTSAGSYEEVEVLMRVDHPDSGGVWTTGVSAIYDT